MTFCRNGDFNEEETTKDSVLSNFKRFCDENDALHQFLQTLIGKELCYIPNPGNGGDSLIAASTSQIFDSCGLHVHSYSNHAQTLASTAEWHIFGGGGNLIPAYGNVKKKIIASIERGKKIDIMPHSIRDNDDLLDALPAGSFVFRREEYTFNYVKERSPKASVFMAHDLALYLDIRLLEENAKKLRLLKSFRECVKTASSRYPEYFHGRTLRAIRKGKEATINPSGENHDFSLYFGQGIYFENASIAS